MRLTGILLLLLFALSASSQNISVSGKITDSAGKPVPFASVYLKNTTTGTSANGEGEYQLKLSTGKYELIVKAIGFRQEIYPLDITSNQVLDIVLAGEAYELKDVVIRGGREDPAFDIIRHAIKKRKSYLHEVKSFTADVYIKGLQKMLGAPKKFLGNDMGKIGREIGLDSNLKGIIYLSESESKLSFMQPDKFREEMISSKVSGSNRAFSFNRASDIKIDFYENIQHWEGLSDRPFISPIADNALFYYNYKLLGSTIENGQMVNKIEVIPRRSTDPVFRGNIYILEDSWRIHSLNLYVTKESSINFVDTLKINQEFFPVGEQVWMPSSVKFDFKGSVFGFHFGGYFTAIYKNYDLNPSLNKKDFAEVLRITKEVNKKDSAYWTQARPVPLTEEERADYKKKEILAAKRESKSYLDSLDKVNNTFKPLRFIIGDGYTIRDRYKKESYHFGSLVNSVFYNTVEGFGINFTASYTRRMDSLDRRPFSLSGKVRYGFSDRNLYGSFFGNVPVKKAIVSFDIGTDVLDLNNYGTISQFGNSVNSLFYELNLLKFYEKKFIQFSVSQHLTDGLVTSFSAEWANRKSLQNTSDYTIRDLADRKFTSNNPQSPDLDIPQFPENQSFKIAVRATYEFNAEYATYPTGKVYRPSKYPRLGMNYTKGIKHIFGSDVDYDCLSFDVSKSDMKLGLYGKFSFWAEAGKFLNANSVYFTDYKHFISTQSLSYMPRINGFLFLDYYNFSTSGRYFEGHTEHNFSGFILNKVPLIRKLKLQEIVGFNYLATPALENYSEFYFGLQYLKFRGLYGMAYQEGKKVNNGFRISYGF
jgi:Family of unknown function (DUF5686)/CarboxypepD_reg-like domain